MELLTPRLRLRELREDDFDALYTVLGDSDITRHYPYTFDETRVRNWIARNRRRYETLDFGLWAVTLRESGELIGDCGLTLQNIHGEHLPEIGYHIRRDRQRRGAPYSPRPLSPVPRPRRRWRRPGRDSPSTGAADPPAPCRS